jgi:BASS family bile acid:Na+ symporter
VGLLLGIAIPLASFVTGLRSTDPFWLWKHPRLLGRSLLAILVAVPALTALLLELVSPRSPEVRAGIMIAILSIGIGPPRLLKRARSKGETDRFEVGLNETLLPLAIVYLPLATALHGAVSPHELLLAPLPVAKVVLLQATLPFVLGVLVAKLFPHRAALARSAQIFVDVAMLIVVLFALVVAWKPLLRLGVSAWLTCSVIAMLGILVGHVLGGPGNENRTVLAGFSAMRFPALSLLLVSLVPGRRALIPVVLAYVICSAILVAVYRVEQLRAVRSTRGHRFPWRGVHESSEGKAT